MCDSRLQATSGHGTHIHFRVRMIPDSHEQYIKHAYYLWPMSSQKSWNSKCWLFVFRSSKQTPALEKSLRSYFQFEPGRHNIEKVKASRWKCLKNPPFQGPGTWETVEKNLVKSAGELGKKYCIQTLINGLLQSILLPRVCSGYGSDQSASPKVGTSSKNVTVVMTGQAWD